MNRVKIIFDYLETEIKCINNWLKAHPKCNRIKLIKEIIILKKTLEILKERTRREDNKKEDKNV